MKKPGLLAAAALLVLAVWEIATLLRVRAAAPVDADWRASRDAVVAERKPGDLIVFAPAWTDPVGRKFLGDLMTIDDAARMDEARYGRVWELSIRGASAGIEGKVAFEKTLGAVRVRRYEREAAEVLWDLRDRDQLLEIDYQPRMCVPVSVPGQLDLGTVPLGRTLALRAGLSDFRERRDNRATAALTVLVGDASVGQITVGSESGWVPLTAATTPGRAHVRIVTSVADSRPPVKLPLCVAAEARR